MDEVFVSHPAAKTGFELCEIFVNILILYVFETISRDGIEAAGLTDRGGPASIAPKSGHSGIDALFRISILLRINWLNRLVEDAPAFPCGHDLQQHR